MTWDGRPCSRCHGRGRGGGSTVIGVGKADVVRTLRKEEMKEGGKKGRKRRS